MGLSYSNQHPMANQELRQALDDAWSSDREHVERITLAAAVLTTALQEAGMTATLVGGGAVEFYAPGAYTTTDIDLVVEGRTREAIDEVMTSLGLRRGGRHWVRGDLFVEVPGNYLSEPADEFRLGSLTLRVIRKEYVLADRIDLSELRATWVLRREAAAPVRARTDPTGMTRPARDRDEAACLRAHDAEGPFIEVDRPGWREWRNGRRP